ncbi:MAG: hypothetical protein ACHP7N_19305 [Caulobacterales bacterium]
MAAFLQNFRNTMILSLILALIMVFAFGSAYGRFDFMFWQATFRWMHVFFGILWIGLLYYFNFVAARKTPEIPAELRPALSKYITPEALFWFRWSALFTVLAGLGVIGLRAMQVPGYSAKVFTLGVYGGFGDRGKQFMLLGIGVYLALIMFINVWGVIWPNQKIALGIIEGDADAKAKAARTAGMFSRINTLLSLPMLTSMAMYQTLFG